MTDRISIPVDGWKLEARKFEDGIEIAIVTDDKPPASHYVRLSSIGLAALRDYLVNASVPSKEPVMWRCKDYADGWITFEREDSAQRYQAQTGCLMQPLYVGPIPLSVSRPLRTLESK